MITGNEPASGYGFTTADGTSHVDEKGLTIRQHFSAIAMLGILSSGIYGMNDNAQYLSDVHNEIKGRCDDAVLWADALIESLNKPTKA